MSAITLKNVIKRYGDVQVVHGIDLEIDKGEFVVLLGPSGCGKTTTLRMVAGLEDVSEGELSIGGRIVNDVAPKDRGVAMVFQNYALYPHMTVRGNMQFALRPMKLSQSEVDRRIAETAEILGLGALLDRRPSQLSGGQRQRVAMGRAMVRTPEVFLFDEPLSNLDAKLRSQVRLEIGKLHQRLGATVLYVTHDQVEAMTLADRIVIMRDGHVEQAGTPEEVYARPVTAFVATFIGSPSMNVMTARIAENRIVAPGISLQVPDRFASSCSDGQEVTLGIRPDDINLVSESDPAASEAKVEVTEYLGSDALIDLRLATHELVAEVSALNRPKPGDTIHIAINENEIHLFDTKSGKSLVHA